MRLVGKGNAPRRALRCWRATCAPHRLVAMALQTLIRMLVRACVQLQPVWWLLSAPLHSCIVMRRLTQAPRMQVVTIAVLLLLASAARAEEEVLPDDTLQPSNSFILS